MKLFPKAAVAALLTPSNLTPGMIPFAALQRKAWKYDGGKYRPESKDKATHDLPIPIWFENRKDSGGPYLQLRCIQVDELTAEEIVAYRDYVERWQEIRKMDPFPPEKLAPVDPVHCLSRAEREAIRQAARSAPPAAPAPAPAPKPPAAVLPPLPYALPSFLQ